MTFKSELLYSNAPAKPLVSFIVPTYKRSDFILETIDSILIQSDLCLFEIVVVNNNPNDCMTDLISRYRAAPISFYRNLKNYGQVGNINLGINLAKGKYVALVHDDDYLLPGYFEKIAFALKDDSIDCVVPSIYTRRDKYKFWEKRRFLSCLFFVRFFYRKKTKKIEERHYIHAFRDIFNPPSCGALFKKQSLEDFGFFADVGGAAWDFYNYRCYLKKHTIVLTRQKLGVYRTFSGMSASAKAKQEFIDDLLNLSECYSAHYPLLGFYGRSLKSNNKINSFIRRIFCTLYYYLCNLDSISPLPKKCYKEKGQ